MSGLTQEKLGEFCGCVTKAELADLEKAMAISLSMADTKPKNCDTQTVAELTARAAEAEMRCAVLQQMYDSLLSRVVR